LFPLLPGSDAPSFRALTKFFASVGINPVQQDYFQWPSFFIFANVLIQVLGWDINAVSKLVFVMTGFLLASTLYLHFAAENEGLGFTGVALYFLGLFWFVNYQFAPQSLALALFMLLVVTTEKRTTGGKITSMIVFTTLVFMHAFMAPLFLLYYTIVSLRRRGQVSLLISFYGIYVAFLIYFAVYHFRFLFLETLVTVYNAFSESGEYQQVLQRALAAPVTALDSLAQVLSRTLAIAIWSILLVGFIYRTIKRDLRVSDLSMLITGIFHFLLGVMLFILGARAVQIFFIPLVAGYKPYVFRAKKVIGICLLFILALFPFTIIHQIYDAGSPSFGIQTPSGQRASDFIIDTVSVHPGDSTVLAPSFDAAYIYRSISLSSETSIVAPWWLSSTQFQSLRYNFVIYGTTLEKEFVYFYHDPELSFRESLLSKCSLAYSDGYTTIYLCRIQ